MKIICEMLSENVYLENPYKDNPAVLSFKELYTGKRRKDPTAWSDYVTSNDFLEVFREERFTAMLLEIVKEHQETYPLCKEFLTVLYTTYGLSYRNHQFLFDNNAAFHGMEHIIEIAEMGPIITHFKGNDPAMANGFCDYRELLLLAAKENWEDDVLLRMGKIIDRYTLSNISDRPIQNESQYELSQRHPKSLRLIRYYFTHANLPKKVYRLLWNHLYLESATSGKNKLFYGELRETVLTHVPELLEKPRTNYRKLNSEYGQYVYYSRHQDDELAKERIHAFFMREDVQDALRDEYFAEEQILRYWITSNTDPLFIKEMKSFYDTHDDVAYRNRILKDLNNQKQWKQVDIEVAEDERSELISGVFDFTKRPYIRHYLHTAFHLAYGIQNGILLSEYLQNHFPYAAKWSKKLTNLREGGFSFKQPLEIRADNDSIKILFHQRYMEYLWNDLPYGKPFSWKDISPVENDTIFWLLLPITVAPFEDHPMVYQELTNRLSRLPVHAEDIPVIADCITGSICHFESDKEHLPICTLYREKEEMLYGCDIYENGVLLLYEETPYAKNMLPNGQYRASDMDMAVSMANQLLQELVPPCSTTLSVDPMPDQIFVRNQWNQPDTLTDKDVTKKALQELLQKYFSGMVNRIELAWGNGSLVFIKDKQQYACMYFSHLKTMWYSFVGIQEVYASVTQDDIIYVPFGLGMMPNYLVLRDTNYMESHLNEIFSQASRPNPDLTFPLWAPHACHFESRLRYQLAKRLFGGYLPEQTRNQLQSRFYIPHMPKTICYTDLDGNSSDTLFVARKKADVQDALFRYMTGKLQKLTLTWEFHEFDSIDEPVLLRRHILLLQDQGKYEMIYLDESKQEVEYLVADVREYISDVKKFRKTTFFGKTVNAYLIHEDLLRIRDYLDLLIPQIRFPKGILDQFGEFSYAGKDINSILNFCKL